MSRLTDPLSTKCSMSPWDWCGLDNVCNRDCFLPEPCKIPKLARRLAEYEDVLYTPDGTEPITLDRLRELVDADLDGRCVVLPCKVGDTVWTRGLIACADCPNGTKPAKICGKTGCPLRPMPMPFRVGMFDNIGKTVFLTRAEAEAALALEGEANV